MTKNHKHDRKIVVSIDGPYVVHGRIPLVHKIQIVSEYGEPLSWQTGKVIETPDTYELCRCGESSYKPFCDVSHALIDFDGTEAADTTTTIERQEIYQGATGIVVKRDYSLCMESGFCGNRFTNVLELVPQTVDTQIRSLVIAMIERCPSGSYTYSIKEGESDVEPDLPQQIAIVTEITSEGPIGGPLWVTGNIPIERSDREPFETRNRVTLCACGHSKQKPLCDGTHRFMNTQENNGTQVEYSAGTAAENSPSRLVRAPSRRQQGVDQAS